MALARSAWLTVMAAERVAAGGGFGARANLDERREIATLFRPRGAGGAIDARLPLVSTRSAFATVDGIVSG